jgi:hypothetical protein
MTVKELKERLKGYPDDMLVVTEDITVWVRKDVPEPDSVSDFDFIHPSICKTAHEKSLYESYEHIEKRVKENGEQWSSDCGEDYFKDYETVKFKPKADCNIEVTEKYREVVLVIGELNSKVDYLDIEHFDENRCLESVLLIS